MGFKDLFKKKEAIDAARFCELCPFLQNVQLNGQFMLKGSNRQIYSVDTQRYLPQDCKRGSAFEVIYDGQSKKLYCVVLNCGYFYLLIDGEQIEISTSNIVSTDALLAGEVPVVLAETYK